MSAAPYATHADPAARADPTPSNPGDKPAGLSLLQRWMLRLVVAFQPRHNVVYTQFYRFHHQYSVLVDRVIPFLCAGRAPAAAQPLRFVLFGCSTGAEPYSLASVLLHRIPDLRFHIHAYDLVPALVDQAAQAVYPRAAVYRSPFITGEFVNQTFDSEGDGFRVKPAVRARVTVAVGDVLDAAFLGALAPADMVLAQNFLFHLPLPQERTAFEHLTRLLKPRSALCIDGMDSALRVELTRRFDLDPVDHLVAEVNHDAYLDSSRRWTRRYWDREPFSTRDPEWLRRFGTVYLRGAGTAAPVRPAPGGPTG